MGSLKKEEEMRQIGEESKEAIVYVNGVRKVLPDGLAHLTLLEYLRALLEASLILLVSVVALDCVIAVLNFVYLFWRYWK
ncbi:hypothetical protein Gotur_008606 [Gossypium turneri]